MSETRNPRPIKRLIKEAIRGVLLGKTDAKERVSISQSTPTDDESLPVIRIYALSESVSRFHESPKDYKRALNVTVEIISNGDNDDDLDSHLEDMGEKVEAIMEIDETLGDLVDGLELVSSAYGTSGDGSSFMGSLFLTYEITFYADAIRPSSTCYPPLIDAEVKIESGPLKEYTSTDLYTFEQGENNG